MAAEKGNEYWLRRKTHGKPKKIKSPQVLWEYACEYFDMVSNNPFIKQDFIRGGEMAGSIVKLETVRPFTWEGFGDYLFEKDVILDLRDYRYNKDDRYNDYAEIITRIGAIIYNQKFEGAAVGAFNSNIIARDLGLSEKTDIKNNSSIKISYNDFNDES